MAQRKPTGFKSGSAPQMFRTNGAKTQAPAPGPAKPMAANPLAALQSMAANQQKLYGKK